MDSSGNVVTNLVVPVNSPALIPGFYSMPVVNRANVSAFETVSTGGVDFLRSKSRVCAFHHADPNDYRQHLMIRGKKGTNRDHWRQILRLVRGVEPNGVAI